jgi:hypothetical protein
MPDEPEEEPEQGEDDREPSLLVRLDEATAQINLVALARFSILPLFNAVYNIRFRPSTAPMKHSGNEWKQFLIWL